MEIGSVQTEDTDSQQVDAAYGNMPINDTDYSHSNMINVLNKEGEIVHQRRQMAESHSDIIAKIQQAAD